MAPDPFRRYYAQGALQLTLPDGVSMRSNARAWLGCPGWRYGDIWLAWFEGPGMLRMGLYVDLTAGRLRFAADPETSTYNAAWTNRTGPTVFVVRNLTPAQVQAVQADAAGDDDDGWIVTRLDT